MIDKPTKIEIADNTETQTRAREVQVLLNVVEPDPEYQPFILTDEACLFDAVATGEDEMLRRLALYFRDNFSFLCANRSGNLWMKLNPFIQTGLTTGVEQPSNPRLKTDVENAGLLARLFATA